MATEPVANAPGSRKKPAKPSKSLRPLETFLLSLVVINGFIFAFAVAQTGPAIFIALPALCLLARQRTGAVAFAVGLTVGTAISAMLLAFMHTVLGSLAFLLWLVGGFPYAVFLCLLNQAHRRLGAVWAMVLTPILWTGIEYFRSEVWGLRFAWILPGQASALLPGVRLAFIGVYGLGFIYMALAALAVGPRGWLRAIGAVGLSVAAVVMFLPAPPVADASLHVAGLQTEFWDEARIASELDLLASNNPEAELLVLSECSFSGPVPKVVRDVVLKHNRYLIAGGKQKNKEGGYYNTAFVIAPDGTDIFQQAKSVPVQFMNDGLPATQRRVWESPWGKIGIAICYDACFATVMDDFVRQGAAALVIPTMDVSNWGLFERRMLHGRCQPIRSAEYGIPTFGVWSSGESQVTDRYGRIVAKAPYPGQGSTIVGTLDLSRPGHVPPDRELARGSMILTPIVAAMSFALWIRDLARRRSQGSSETPVAG